MDKFSLSAAHLLVIKSYLDDISSQCFVEYNSKLCNKTLLFFLGGTSPDTENDFLLAQMMQLEYDKEYDRTIDSMEKRYNGESKGIAIFC